MTHWGLLRQKKRRYERRRNILQGVDTSQAAVMRNREDVKIDNEVFCDTVLCPYPTLYCTTPNKWHCLGIGRGFVSVRGIGSVNYENKFLLLFSATFGFMHDAKQNKTKPSPAKSTVWQFFTQIIVSAAKFDDVRCEVLLRMLGVWGVTLGWLTFASCGIH